MRRRKRGEVNSLSSCFINNVTQRLTEWLWMAAERKRPECLLHHHFILTPRLDLFNLGDKFSSDPAAEFIFCLLTFWGEFFIFSPPLFPPCVSCYVLAELGSVFLSKSHVIALPSTCVLVYEIKVCVRACVQNRQECRCSGITCTHAALQCTTSTRVWSSWSGNVKRARFRVDFFSPFFFLCTHAGTCPQVFVFTNATRGWWWWGVEMVEEGQCTHTHTRTCSAGIPVLQSAS